MTTREMILFLLVCAVGLAPVPAAAQNSDQELVNMMLDCAMHEKAGPWVDKDLRRDGLLRFSYLHEPPQGKGNPNEDPANLDSLYVAFWNPSKTKGTFLHFVLDRAGSRRQLTISNEGWISSSHGKLDLEIFQGGVWTHDHLLTRVAKLSRSRIHTARVRDIKRTSAVCDSLAAPTLP